VDRGPLQGVRVACFAEQFPGPYASMLLSDLGADVVLIERPSGDPMRSMPWMFNAINRGKRSIVLDLKSDVGLASAIRLIEHSDVVLEGYRPGVADRLGIGRVSVTAKNPDLVYVSISGFGQDGPYRLLPAHDISYQGVAGVLDPQISPQQRTSELDDPSGLPLADLAAGMFAAQAVLVGLLARRKDRGVFIDVSMTDALISWMTTSLVAVTNASGPATVPYDPAYGVFPTADGRFISISVAFEQPFWEGLCDALDIPESRSLGPWERRERKVELRRRIANAVRAADHDVVLAALIERSVPCARVNALAEVHADPQVRSRAMFVEVARQDGNATESHVRQPLIVDGIAYGPTTCAPTLGEHSADILSEVGWLRAGPDRQDAEPLGDQTGG
jgi:crotonobetainyl-CoA:carnitine CoA-transferase CaiB-like acyl-CoA transferase